MDDNEIPNRIGNKKSIQPMESHLPANVAQKTKDEVIYYNSSRVDTNRLQTPAFIEED